MRYQNLNSFSKHLASAAPHNLCRCYLVLISDDYERKKATDAILAALAAPRERIQAVEGSAVLDALSCPFLFGGEPIVLLEEAEKIPKAALEQLLQFLQMPMDSGYFIVASRNKTPLAEIIEQQGVILDLLDEKPWDKEKRLAQQIEKRVESAGKRLSSDAWPLLFERIGPEPALLDQEIDKLLCYVGNRLTVERSDIFRISGAFRTHTLWQLADEIVWEEGLGGSSPDSLPAFLPYLRSQLYIGLKLALLIEAKTPPERWSSYIPKMWPKTMEKRAAAAAKKGSVWFQKGLDLLFQIEVLSRDGSSHTNALFDLFRLKMVS